MQRSKLGFGMLFCIAITAMISSQASAQLLFNFDNDFPETSFFDSGQGIGVSQAATALDGSPAATVANVTTVDLFAPEFADDGTGVFAPTGNTLFASAGDGVGTDINNNSLGIDNPSVSDEDFFGGAGIETRDFNDGEGWVVEFDIDVTFTSLDFASLDAGFGVMTVTIDGLRTFDFVDDVAVTSDNFIDPFGALVIPAGTDITFSYATPNDEDGNVRINSFTVVDAGQEVLLGDVDLNGTVSFLDIAPFINLLSAQGFQDEADIDLNGVVSFLDIAPFIAILSGG